MKLPFPAVLNEYLSTHRGTLENAIKNWGVVLTGLFAERIALALVLILVAKKVTPLEYGQYTASYSLLSFLVVLPSFGLDTWLLTRGKSSPAQVLRLWKSSLLLRGKFVGIWVAGTLLLSLILPKDTFPTGVMIASIFGIALDSFTLLAFAALRNLNQHGWVTAFQSGAAIALLALTVVLPLENGKILFFALGRMALSVLFALLLYALPGRVVWHKNILLSTVELIGEARTFMWADLSSAVYVRADITLLSLMLGAGATGIYGPAINILQLSFLAPRALFFFIVPMLARAYNQTLQSFLRRGIVQIIIQLLIGIALSAILYLGAAPMIQIVFGTKYSGSIGVLVLLSPIPLFRALNFALGAMLASADFQNYRTKIQVSSAVFNVLGNLLMIPRIGVAGAAIIYTLSELLLLIGYLAISVIWIRKGTKIIHA